MSRRYSAIALALCAVLFFGIAFFQRRIMLDKYNAGVKYYENGDYISALEIFDSLRGYGYKDGLPEKYYGMALDKLLKRYPNTIICPHCGNAIRIKNKSGTDLP